MLTTTTVSHQNQTYRYRVSEDSTGPVVLCYLLRHQEETLVARIPQEDEVAASLYLLDVLIGWRK